MIRQIGVDDKHLIEGMELTPNALKILAIYKGYGFGRSFVKFYADEKGDIVFALKSNKAYLYLRDHSRHEEAAIFCRLIATSLLTEFPMETLTKTEGGILFENANVSPKMLDGVTSDSEATFAVLCNVFPKTVNSTSYPMWHTDTSHMVRHGVSALYTVAGICSATVSINAGGSALITHLGTVSAHKKQGYASRLLSHIVGDQVAKKLVLFSQDLESDGFYDKNGYTRIGEWFFYDFVAM